MKIDVSQEVMTSDRLVVMMHGDRPITVPMGWIKFMDATLTGLYIVGGLRDLTNIALEDPADPLNADWPTSSTQGGYQAIVMRSGKIVSVNGGEL